MSARSVKPTLEVSEVPPMLNFCPPLLSALRATRRYAAAAKTWR